MNDIPYRAALDRRRRPRRRRFAGAALFRRRAEGRRRRPRRAASSAPSPPRPAPRALPPTPPIPLRSKRLFEAAEAKLGEIDVVVYNVGARIRGPLAELDPEAVRQAIDINAFGGFLVAREAAKRFEPARARRAVLHRRDLEPQGLCDLGALRHGQIRAAGAGPERRARIGAQGRACRACRHRRRRSATRAAPIPPTPRCEPDAIADAYLDLLRQKRSAWSFEVELRPWVGEILTESSNLPARQNVANRNQVVLRVRRRPWASARESGRSSP